jgi:tRNA(Ile)-lysidine synthase
MHKIKTIIAARSGSGVPECLREPAAYLGAAFAEARGAVLAVSGGSDSLGLLHLAARLPRPGLVVVGFVDHGLREGIDAEWELVRRQSVGLGFRAERLAVGPSSAVHRKDGLQQWARERRYALLVHLAQQEGASLIATGHTLDDQAETVLSRLLRGAGVDGLGGIPRCRHIGSGISVLRPLLTVARRDIRHWLSDIGVDWAEDPSNRDARFERVRIRREALPLLESIHPQAGIHVAAVAREAAALGDWLDGHWRNAGVVERLRLGNGVVVRPAAFAGLPDPLRARIVRLALREVVGHLRRVERVHIDGMVAGLRGGHRTRFHGIPGSAQVCTAGGALYVFPQPLPPAGPADDIRCADGDAGQLVDPSIGVTAVFALSASLSSAKPVLRRRRPGDRIMGTGTRLQARFIDGRIPSCYRPLIPVLAIDGEGVIAAPGVVPCTLPDCRVEWRIAPDSPLADLPGLKPCEPVF